MKRNLFEKSFLLRGLLSLLLLVAITGNAWGETKIVTLSQANIYNNGLGAATGYQTINLLDEAGNTWRAYAIKNNHSNATKTQNYLQIKKYASGTAYYIQVPELGSKITNIKLTVSSSSQPMNGGGNTTTVYFSNSNSTSSAGTGVVSATGDSSISIDVSSLNLNTGYITAGGAIRIWEITVIYEDNGGTPPATPYTVTFNAGSNGTCSTTTLTEASAGAGVTLPNVTANAGYNFKGWSTSSTPTSADAGVAGDNYKPSSDCTLYALYAATHTAKFYVNGIQTGDTQILENGDAITFPAEKPADINGKTFVGWITTTIDGTTNTAPSFVTSATMGDSDMTFYAVFATASGEGEESWDKITDASKVTTGTYAIITYDEEYYLPNAEATNGAPKVGVAKTNEKIALNDDMKWELQIVDNNYIFKSCRTNCVAYLWGAPTNEGIRIVETSTKSNAFRAWTLESSNAYGLILKDAGNTGRYLSTYGTQDWRNYTNTSTVNRAANLYKLVSGTTYSDYCTSVAEKKHATLVISENGKDVSLNYGESKSVSIRVSENDYDGILSVTSADESVATVTYSGTTAIIKYAGEGETYIKVTAPATDNYAAINETQTIKVTTTDNRSEATITISPSAISLENGATLEVTLGVPNGYNGTLSVSTANQSIATATYANSKVTIEGKAVGSTTLNVTAEGTSTYKPVSLTFDITVTKVIAKGIKALRQQVEGTSAAAASNVEAELTNAIVTYVSTTTIPTIYLEDSEAGIAIYATNTNLAVGDVLNGTLTGTGYIFNGLTELNSIDLTNITKTTTTNIPCSEVTLSQIESDGMEKWESRRVIVKNLEITSAMNNRNAIVKQGETSFAVYEKVSGCSGSKLSDTNQTVVSMTGYPQDNKYENQISIWEENDIVIAKSAYTVTFKINGTTTTLTESEGGAGVTVPTIPEISNYSFIGWTSNEIASETSISPTFETIDGSMYYPTSNTTLYALYKRSEVTGTGGTYELRYDNEEMPKGSYARELTPIHVGNGVVKIKNIGRFISNQTREYVDYFQLDKDDKDIKYGEIKVDEDFNNSVYTVRVNFADENPNEATLNVINGDNTFVLSNNITSCTLNGSTDFLMNSKGSARFVAITSIEFTCSGVVYYYTTLPSPKVITEVLVSGNANRTEYYDGDVFDPTGLVVTATYSNGESETITDGFNWSFSPTNLTLGTTTVNVTATYQGVESDPRSVIVTVFERPKYTVTFSIIGEKSTKTETTAGEGVEVPAVDDVAYYKFIGWATNEIPEEITTAPSCVSITDGKYFPENNTTLYAVYKRTEGGDEGEPVSYSFDVNDNDIPTEYGSGIWTRNNTKFSYLNIARFSNSSTPDEYMQIRKKSSTEGNGMLRNDLELPSSISNIIVTYHSSAIDYDITVSIGNKDSWNETNEPVYITPSINGDIYTFNCSNYNYKNFLLQNEGRLGKVTNITIICGGATTTAYYTTLPKVTSKWDKIAIVGDFHATNNWENNPMWLEKSEDDPNTFIGTISAADWEERTNNRYEFKLYTEIEGATQPIWWGTDQGIDFTSNNIRMFDEGYNRVDKNMYWIHNKPYAQYKVEAVWTKATDKENHWYWHVTIKGISDTYLPGNWFGNWTTGTDERVKFDEDGVLELDLNSGNYEFKVTNTRISETTWYGNNGTMTSDNCTDWDFSTSAGNCGINATITGTYTFYLTWNGETPTISVKYPEYITLTIGQTGYATYYNSSLTYIMPEDCEGYVAYYDQNDNWQFKVVYEGKSVVPAGEALVLHTSNPGDKTLVASTTEEQTCASQKQNDLQGTDETVQLDNNPDYYYYGFSKGHSGTANADKLGFYWRAENGAAFENGAHKAYLMVLKNRFESNPAKAGGFSIEDLTNGISNVNINTNEVLYNLNGQRINTPKCGQIYIMNGRKYIAK